MLQNVIYVLTINLYCTYNRAQYTITNRGVTVVVNENRENHVPINATDVIYAYMGLGVL